MTNIDRYESYLQLLAKVDAMFNSVMEREPDQFACRVGCHGCCLSGLSVSNVEAAYIRQWLIAHPEVKSKIQNSELMMNSSEFCSLLDHQGQCSIYEVRPLICRSHGMPISWSEPEGSDDKELEHRDVCPLNFVDVALDQIGSGNVLAIDKINTILSLINRVVDSDKSEVRTLLSEIASAK